MSEKQNIDRFFQEKFKDFEAQPSPKVWQGIEARLKEKDDRKVIPFWFKLSGIAAALLIGLLITYNVQNTPDGADPGNSVVIEQDPSVNGSKAGVSPLQNDAMKNSGPESSSGEQIKELEPVPENGYETGIASENADQNNGASNTGKRSGVNNATRMNDSEHTKDQRNNAVSKSQFLNTAVNKAVASSDKKKKRRSTQQSADQDQIAKGSDDNNSKSIADQNQKTAIAESNAKAKTDADQERNTIDNPTTLSPEQKKSIENKIAAATGDDTKTDTTAIATVVPNTLEELLKEKENKTVTTNEPKLNRWQISTNVAPIYFSSTSNNSPIDSRLAESSKEYKADLTYGIGVRYALNKKLTVRAGVNTVGMEYTTNELAFVQTTNARALKNVDPNLQGSLIHIVAKPGSASALTPEPADNGRKFASSLSQRTGYIEVPLEMSYKVLDRKFGIEVIGGISTLFLNENSVSLISSGIEMEIGKASNLNDMHFSTNVGVGFRYNFLKNFQLNVEPMFKYQVNTFSHSRSYNPYIFGVYSGINYRF